jgi:hypothetical protein
MATLSPLLRLPCELRNKIYKYALSSPTPLILNSDTSGLPAQLLSDIDGVTQEFNQLKYVSKQLYAETVYTEMRYNDIKVSRKEKEDDPPGSQFLSWIYALMPPTRLRLNGATIVLMDEPGAHGISSKYMPDTARTVSYFARFCNAHPAVAIHYHLPQLHFEIPEGPNVGEFWSELEENIRESIYVALFPMPALISEDIGYGSDVFDAWIMEEQSTDAGYWREVFELEQLHAHNNHYLPSAFGNVELLREQVEHIFGHERPTTDLIMRCIEYGLKA